MVDESVYEDALNRSFNYTQNHNPKQLNSNDFEVRLKKLGNNFIDIPGRSSIGSTAKEVELIDTSKPLNLADIDFKLNQARLKCNQNPANFQSTVNSKQPVYYKPPNSTMKFTKTELGDFLPPAIMDTTVFQKIPLLIPKKDIVAAVEVEEDSVHPSGQWVNPIMKQALSRQINKEMELKKLIKLIFYLILLYLIQSIVNRLILILQSLNQEKKIWVSLDDLSTNIYYASFVTVITIYFVVQSIISVYRLFKQQDQCLDLPLNDQQRELIGLDLNPETIQDDQMINNSELILKQRQYDLNHGKIDYKLPKYSKFNNYLYDNLQELSNSSSKNNISRSKSPSDLTQTFNNDKVHRIGENSIKTPIMTTPLFNNHQDFNLEQVKFNQDFNLKFDCKNDF